MPRPSQTVQYLVSEAVAVLANREASTAALRIRLDQPSLRHADLAGFPAIAREGGRSGDAALGGLRREAPSLDHAQCHGGRCHSGRVVPRRELVRCELGDVSGLSVMALASSVGVHLISQECDHHTYQHSDRIDPELSLL